jgi:hypothetical protein
MSSTLGEPAPATPLLGAAGLGVLLEAMPDARVRQLVEILVPRSSRIVHQAQREGYLADPRTRSLGTEHQFIGVRRDGTESGGYQLVPRPDRGCSVGDCGGGDMTARNEAKEDRRLTTTRTATEHRPSIDGKRTSSD